MNASLRKNLKNTYKINSNYLSFSLLRHKVIDKYYKSLFYHYNQTVYRITKLQKKIYFISSKIMWHSMFLLFVLQKKVANPFRGSNLFIIELQANYSPHINSQLCIELIFLIKIKFKKSLTCCKI